MELTRANFQRRNFFESLYLLLFLKLLAKVKDAGLLSDHFNEINNMHIIKL